MFRALKPYQLAIDISIAALCFLLRSVPRFESVPLLVVVLGMALALALRRLSPTLALGIAWVAVIIQLVTMSSVDVSNAAILPVLYGTAAYGTSVVRWLGLVSAPVGAAVATAYVVVTPYSAQNLLGTPIGDLPQFLVLALVGFFSALALFGLSWTLGLLVRTWRTARESRAAEAQAQANQQLAERDVAIEQERNRIARDMHDVVAHSLAVVIAQADGARYARAHDPDAVDEALTTISTTAREALGDVRILLGQLRHSQGEGPQPVLADLETLLDSLRASGLRIFRDETGVPLPLGTGAQLAVYRIVQESLTNVLRHGDAAADVIVRFGWSDTGLELEVSSGLLTPSAPEDPAARAGHGLDGMRERALLVGGELKAGPRDERFLVAASIPAQLVSLPIGRSL